MRNKKNKIKSDPTQEVNLYRNITIFARTNFSTHRMEANFILQN